MSEQFEEVDFDMGLDEILFDMDLQDLPGAIDAFYEKHFNFSYSSMKLLLHNPVAFMEKYIHKNYEEKLDKHLINGKLIHCLILEPDQLNEQFLISPTELPGGKGKDVLIGVFKHHMQNNGAAQLTLDDYSGTILTKMIECDLFQALTDDKPKAGTVALTGDQKRLAKILTDENRSFFHYLKNCGNKNIVDQKQFDFCKVAAEVIRLDERLKQMMGFNADSTKNEVINEKLFEMPLESYSFGLKGIIDNINIDHANKVIYVNDFKTTNKTLNEFPEAVIFYCYHYQAVIYLQLVTFNFKNLVDQGYKVEFRFIAIDRNLQAYPFTVKKETLNKWFEELQQKLKEADFHYTGRTYDLPYAFANNLVSL